METPPLIYARIAQCLAEVGAVGKDHKNAQQGYSFRGIDDFYDAFQPVLARNKVFIAPTILEHTREERTTKNGGTLMSTITKVRFKIYTEDGSFIEADALGEGSDSGDKSANKAAAQAMKYLFMQVFSVRVRGESLDTERESPAYAPRQPQSTPKPYQMQPERTYQKNTPAAPQERTAATSAEVLPSIATAIRRDKVNAYLDGQFALPDLEKFFESKGWVSEWPLEQVPVTNAALSELVNEINAFIAANSPPSENGTQPLVESDDLPQELRDQIITLPRKGSKRSEYFTNGPDTIGSLWDAMKNGDGEAQRRLYGVASNWNPEPYVGADGKKYPVSKEDAECRIALDQFLAWTKEKNG